MATESFRCMQALDPISMPKMLQPKRNLFYLDIESPI